MLVEMSDPDPASHILKDIEPGAPGDQWRWTGRQPTVKILAATTQNLKLIVDFTLWPVAFQQTGPVALSFLVNDRVLDKIRYTTPGEFAAFVTPNSAALRDRYYALVTATLTAHPPAEGAPKFDAAFRAKFDADPTFAERSRRLNRPPSQIADDMEDAEGKDGDADDHDHQLHDLAREVATHRVQAATAAPAARLR